MTLFIHNCLFVENYVALIIWVICGKVSQFPAVSKTEGGKALKNLPFFLTANKKRVFFTSLLAYTAFL